MNTMRIGFLLFPGMLQLDFTGAYGVLAAGVKAEIRTVWKDASSLKTSDNLIFTPDTTFAACPPLDVIIVPGGGGIVPLMGDAVVLDFLRTQAESASYVASVCTGALVLGAAGLLRGFKATTHWLSHDLLTLFGAEPVPQRVVIDGNRVTAAGVTSGIDMALLLAGRMWGDDVAQSIQLNMEYAPEPPYMAGNPTTAPQSVVATAHERGAARQAERLAAATAAAKRLETGMC